jgi:hypothetical protein
VLAAAGLVLIALSVAAFYFRLRLGLFSRFPFEQFLLVGTAFVLGLAAAFAEPGPLTFALLAIEAAAVVLVIRYLGIGARFPGPEVAVKSGERFPDFALPDSEGGTVDSRSLRQSTAGLFIFYRGDF